MGARRMRINCGQRPPRSASLPALALAAILGHIGGADTDIGRPEEAGIREGRSHEASPLNGRLERASVPKQAHPVFTGSGAGTKEAIPRGYPGDFEHPSVIPDAAALGCGQTPQLDRYCQRPVSRVPWELLEAAGVACFSGVLAA